MGYDKTPVFDDSSLGGQIITAFSVGHFDEAACRRTLLKILRPAPICPGCQRSFTAQETERMLDDRDIRCDCGRKSAPRSGTVLDGVHAEYRVVLLIACMAYWGVKPAEIVRHINVSLDTVRRITERLKVPLNNQGKESL